MADCDSSKCDSRDDAVAWIWLTLTCQNMTDLDVVMTTNPGSSCRYSNCISLDVFLVDSYSLLDKLIYSRWPERELVVCCGQCVYVYWTQNFNLCFLTRAVNVIMSSRRDPAIGHVMVFVCLSVSVLSVNRIMWKVAKCKVLWTTAMAGCLTLLEIYWNKFSLLEIYWKLAKSPGNFLADSKFLYFTVYQ